MMDPKQAVEFARNLTNGEWKVSKIMDKDMHKIKNREIYDVFCVVYDKSEQIVKNW